MPIKIIVENNKSRIICSLKTRLLLINQTKIKAKGYFWSPAYRSRQWDGFIRYVSEVNGMFSTGLLDQITSVLDEAGKKWKIIDNRKTFKPIRNLKSIGNKKFFGHQINSLKSFFNNKVAGIPFLRGILAEATNAGKSVIAAGIIGSFSKKKISIVLVNNLDLFAQTYRDLVRLFGEDVGFINSGTFNWKRINVCMVQTLGNRIKNNPQYRNVLAKVDIVIVDESDELIGRKDCKMVLNACYNAPVRVAFTGTALKNKGKLKDKRPHGGSTRNQEELAFFGPIIHSTTNREMVDRGISTMPNIQILSGNKEIEVKGNYTEEYLLGIIKNKKRHKRIWNRVIQHIKKKRLPILILFKYHKHGKNLYNSIPVVDKQAFNIVMVHGKSKIRKSVIGNFNKGKIDILICSMIIRRGINIPRMKVLINAAGGDSEKNVLQVFGRAIRKHESKKKVYIDDFYDVGVYLKRHSKHRIKYYRDQKFPVKEKFELN